MQDFLQIKIVDFDSDLQKQSINLRFKVLREPLGLVFTSDQLKAESNQIHIVATQHKTVVGVLLLKILDNTTLQMRQVAVDPSYQKNGIGKELVLFSKKYAFENSFQKIKLHARLAATNFYLKLGYIKIGEPFEEVGIPHFYMEKTIV
jgi:predicted GNAT family N-acyltransferase